MKVLFSTTWGPFQEQFFNTSPVDVMNQRFSRGCDIFTMNGHLHSSFAHLIAQNIDAPSVFLEYPRREDFHAEIEKGYDYIGISSYHNQVDDLIEMCQVIRAKAPESKIVLGGFGAVGLEATLSKEELAALCDHLCHEEGTRFFRRVIGEDPDRPMFHSHLPKWGTAVPMLDRNPAGKIPVVVGSLGCPNGCDFCGTTEMFHKTRVPIMSPEQVHREFQRAWRADPNCPQLSLLEEDTFKNVEFITELGRLLREDSEFGLAYYNYYGLASNRSMSQWTFEDMALTGCATVFVGVESKFAGGHGYTKTHGLTYKEQFDGLHNVGITTTGAWMIGFDFQTRENIHEDLQHFISLYPCFQQLTRVCPFPATPLWKQLKEEGRIREDVKWTDISFYGGGGMVLKNLHEHEIREIIEDGYRQLYRAYGPTAARMINVSLQGYEYCMENRHRNKYLAELAQRHKRMASGTFSMLKSFEIYAPNGNVRKQMKDLRRTYIRLFGEPTAFQKMAEKTLLCVSAWTKIKDLVYPRDNILMEETYKKYVYDKPAPEYPECPYRVEYPRRTLRYSSKLFAKNLLGNVLGGAIRFSQLFDPAPAPEPEKEAEPEETLVP